MSNTIFQSGLLFCPEDGGSRLLRNVGARFPSCINGDANRSHTFVNVFNIESA